ncbi:MAG TPA: UbiA family prenyltransferase [Bacteroidales bacterium]
MKQSFFLSWFDQSTVKHLRFHFSFYLMPVFLFALSQTGNIRWPQTILSFIILHFLIFPASNGYNSYQDRDETSIGGIKHPPKVNRNLFYVTLLFDITGIICGIFISVYFSLMTLIFVLMSRAYSYRGIRLKKYPIIGFLTVFIFQGGFVYLIASSAISHFSFETFFTINQIICMGIASLFLGSAYPLTQIYQHEADKRDGVISISYKLGYNGTFIFSAVLFSLATILLIYYFEIKNQQIALFLFSVLMLPVIVKLSVWFNKVRRNTDNANFENTMNMNFITSTCMNLYFSILILNHIWTWF